ncbi:MAG TPA: S9 family peptidase [Allosphingosinicella sp.]|nr:S9 family peptidase [Allosphingosinicella sp.]
MIRNFLLGASALALLSVGSARPAIAQAPARITDPAILFGARDDVSQISLSPSGTQVAFVAPGPGPSTVLYVSAIDSDAAPKIALSADGTPSRIKECHWVSDTRLFCDLYLIGLSSGELLEANRIVAVNADGTDVKMLSREQRPDDAYAELRGGDVIDSLPGEENAVLMNREYVPSEAAGTHMVDTREGLGVDRLDTLSLSTRSVEPPRKDAAFYISDGHGRVRIMGTRKQAGESGYDKAGITYYYRPKDSNGWKSFGADGFTPVAVDPDLNLAYGFKTKDGRRALYTVSLDEAKTETLVLARPDVDIDGLIRIGRRDRVVGASYVTDKRQAVYFDKDLQALAASLSKALPGLPLIAFLDSSLDESKLLLWAGSDKDPGRYYLFDRKARQLHELMLERADLEGVRLADQKPVSFKAADGTIIPAYLTLPPGSSGRNLPAIVLPHGGPAERDEWGFDWLSQYFAARGYAVLQPEFRGSTGYGDAYFVHNGFQSWKTAIGDVDDAGRWLVAQGIAAPDKLAIFGWSYGGYAALQANVLDPNLFKAAVAVAPVTDLAQLAEERRGWSDYLITEDFIGSGPQVREGSPAQNADRILAPVLLFHGDLDINVGVRESKLMDEKLKAAGKQVELVVYPGLDHQLEDSAVRADMLRKADAFLRSALKIQ